MHDPHRLETVHSVAVDRDPVTIDDHTKLPLRNWRNGALRRGTYESVVIGTVFLHGVLALAISETSGPHRSRALRQHRLSLLEGQIVQGVDDEVSLEVEFHSEVVAYGQRRHPSDTRHAEPVRRVLDSERC